MRLRSNRCQNSGPGAEGTRYVDEVRNRPVQEGPPGRLRGRVGRSLPTLTLCASVIGCAAPPVDLVDDPIGSFADGVTWPDAATPCSDPAPFSITERQASEGFGPEDDLQDPLGFQAAVVARDVDGDGDIDVLRNGERAPPTLYLNDGTGRFDAGTSLWTVFDTPVGAPTQLALADLDGDRLPEVIAWDVGWLLIARNLGGGQFGPPEATWVAPDAGYSIVASIALGDADGDGDLDIAVGTTWSFSELPQGSAPVVDGVAPDLLLRNDDGVFGFQQTLIPEGGAPALGQTLLWTDRDADGDLDLLVGSDQGGVFPPTAFYRNDDGVFVDDAQAVSADLQLSAMGIAARDLNDDGALDYCMTDVGPVACLLSGPEGYVESGTALGLVADHAERTDRWSGWGIEFADLDGDGWDDVLAVAALPGPPEWPPEPDDPALMEQPDALWMGGPDGFVNRSEELGFASIEDHWGLAVADFDADGALEWVTAGAFDGLRYWDVPCTENTWVTVQLVGPPGNRGGFGARVEVRSPGARGSGSCTPPAPRGSPGPGCTSASAPRMSSTACSCAGRTARSRSPTASPRSGTWWPHGTTEPDAGAAPLRLPHGPRVGAAARHGWGHPGVGGGRRGL